jgi:hypothetical protein
MNRFTTLTPVDEQGQEQSKVVVDLANVLWMERIGTGTLLYIDDPECRDGKALINALLRVAECREEILSRVVDALPLPSNPR